MNPEAARAPSEPGEASPRRPQLSIVPAPADTPVAIPIFTTFTRKAFYSPVTRRWHRAPTTPVPEIQETREP